MPPQRVSLDTETLLTFVALESMLNVHSVLLFTHTHPSIYASIQFTNMS